MGSRVKRLGLVAAMALVTLNIWTGAPLLGLWVGSRVAPPSGVSMTAIAVVAITIAVVCFALVRVLGILSARYDSVVGRRPTTRRHTPWLRAMSGARPHEMGFDREALTPLDYILVGAVILVVALFEAWFFFKAGSPFDARSGRG